MPTPQSRSDTAPRLLGFLFGFIFAGIGLTVIGFLWTADGFGAPPLFFRIVGSFIALGFIGMGSMFLTHAINGPKPPPEAQTPPGPASAASPSTPDAPVPAAGYTCPACGARLGENADVSPKGDVKCGYCRKWFNIHG
jgi:hypothetical protein